MSIKQEGAKIGLLSRIDYGSKGFRRGLVRVGIDILRQQGTHYNILLGGLISKDAISQRMKMWVNERLRKDKVQKRVYQEFEKLLPREQIKARKEQLQEEFLKLVAKELANIIPVVTIKDPENHKKEKLLDFFIITSPAFDGEIGEIVANNLASIRSDVRVWNTGGDRFLVKYVDKLIWALAPQKAVWMRGDYYSTAVERVIKDKTKQTPQGSPDVYIVGCFGSSINKPRGELRYAYLSAPALHRLETTRVNENQVGVSILEYSNKGEYSFSTFSLKDLVGEELSFIVPPEKATFLQKKMIEQMKIRGWATPGILRYHLKDYSINEIVKEMKALMQKKTIRRIGENWPGITFQESGKKYYFDLSWIQDNLKYPNPVGPWHEDKIVSFACLHAGSVESDYKFFTKDVPKYILKTGATILVDAGDTKEGMKHSLDRKGEIIAGINNTKQEKLAASLIGQVIFKVFEERFTQAIRGRQENYIEPRLEELISQNLLEFNYILGNHDLWESDDGHDPLELFHVLLVRFLADSICKLLSSVKLTCRYEQIMKVVESKVLRREFFDLSSGLKVSVQHPHMSRAKTTSLRPQEMLEFAKRHNAQVAIGGNFHVSENVEDWDMDLGQCVCQEVGTIKHGSNFERHKMKMVDQGVGYLRIISSNSNDKKQPRIFMTQSAFYGEPQLRPPIDNLEIINAFLKDKLDVSPIKKT